MSASRGRPPHEKAGSLAIYTDQDAWTMYHAVLKGNTLKYFTEGSDATLVGTIRLEDCDVSVVSRDSVERDHCILLSHQVRGEYIVAAQSAAEMKIWLQVFHAATVPTLWTGGSDFSGRPKPISLAAIKALGADDPQFPLDLPKVTESEPARRRMLLLRKFRLCSIVLTPQEMMTPSLRFRDVKRETIGELIDVQSTNPDLFRDWRVLDEAFIMIQVNLLRALQSYSVDGGDAADDDSEPFLDPLWPHLSAVYELLLHLVSNDGIDGSLKKRFVDPAFIRQLIALFDSEDIREREYLKTITHRVYSKLTQRRALIRRVICHTFFEFVFETRRHNGIAEMLEILASIINGFAVPIKEEHKVMLVRALLPLHKSPAISQYHPQLSYCMALYVAKDHTLTQKVVPGLLRFWPFGNSSKQIMFLNELEDVFEYVQQSDVTVFRDQLARRLAKCIGGLHFQVAERALGLWSSERFTFNMVECVEHRAPFLMTIFPALYVNSSSHWHESVRAVSQGILDLYADVDQALLAQCMQMLQDGELQVPSDPSIGYSDSETKGKEQ